MKNLMVIFDSSPTALQNLRVALKFIQTEKEKTQDKLKLLVCVPEVLREDIPLDDYLGEMERATCRASDLAQQVLDEAGLAEIRPEILRETVSKAAQAIAHRAEEWHAEQLFINLDKLCAECAANTGKRRGFLGRHRAHTLPARQVSEGQPIVDLNTLLQLVNCRITFTCHNQQIMSVRVHQPCGAKLRSGV